MLTKEPDALSTLVDFYSDLLRYSNTEIVKPGENITSKEFVDYLNKKDVIEAVLMVRVIDQLKESKKKFLDLK